MEYFCTHWVAVTNKVSWNKFPTFSFKHFYEKNDKKIAWKTKALFCFDYVISEHTWCLLIKSKGLKWRWKDWNNSLGLKIKRFKPAATNILPVSIVFRLRKNNNWSVSIMAQVRSLKFGFLVLRKGFKTLVKKEMCFKVPGTNRNLFSIEKALKTASCFANPLSLNRGNLALKIYLSSYSENVFRPFYHAIFLHNYSKWIALISNQMSILVQGMCVICWTTLSFF